VTKHAHNLGAMAGAHHEHPLNDDVQAPPLKKLKISDLPISQTKRAAIDNLVHTFRKKGDYDFLRKKLFTQFETDVSEYGKTVASIT
jgi:hypothetical protein